MTITKHAALLLTTLVGFTGLLNAQTSTTVKAQVPFAFVASGKTMPAGGCTIAAVVNGRTLLTINSGEQHAYVLPIADASPKSRKKTALLFHRYGDRYFLTGITRENGSGYQLPASKLERELQARNLRWQVFTLLASAK